MSNLWQYFEILKEDQNAHSVVKVSVGKGVKKRLMAQVIENF
jgi:hypothetical protein